MKLEVVPIDSLVLDPANARKHPEKNLEAIKGYSKVAECEACGRSRVIRKDSKARRCRKCSAGIGGKSLKPNRVTGANVPCVNCGKPVWAFKCETGKRKFCSKSCHDKSRTKYPKQVRQCATCSKEFEANDKPHSNSSGKYCSRVCRDIGYTKPATAEHRSRWRKTRKAFIAQGNNFCALCGETHKRLHVHHVIPYRVRPRDDFDNLITLCTKCHGRAEKISDKIALLDEEKREIAAAVFMADAWDYWLMHKSKTA